MNFSENMEIIKDMRGICVELSRIKAEKMKSDDPVTNILIEDVTALVARAKETM